MIVRFLRKLSMESSVGFASLVSTVPRGSVSPVPIVSFEMAQRTRVDTNGDYFTEVWRQPTRPGVFLRGEMSYFTAMWSQGYVGGTFSFWYPGRDRGIAQVPLRRWCLYMCPR